MTHPTHLVLIPSFNTGPALLPTLRAARTQWAPVWVVIDGSTDGSAEAAEEAARADPDLRVLRLPHNSGKGAAVLAGLRAADMAGYTHALVMDADGQHPAAAIPDFMAQSIAAPDMLILGQPVFGPDAPWPRVIGRKFSNILTHLETAGLGRIGDSLFGFRVYPVAALRSIMESSRWMRGFDFDNEAAVRLVWRGFRPINRQTTVRYFAPDQNGVSHFRYIRDNLRLIWMHTRLLWAAIRGAGRQGR